MIVYYSEQGFLTIIKIITSNSKMYLKVKY